MATTPARVTGASHSILRTLHRGDTGNDVKRLQTFLAGRKFAVVADGTFGTLTEEAVKNYQRTKVLTADGWVGRQTLLALLADGLDAIALRNDGAAYPPAPDFLQPITSNQDRAIEFGKFAYRPAPERDNPEAIEITDDWAERNIIRVTIPALAHVHPGPIPLHKLVVADFQAFFAAVLAAGLHTRIIAFDGSWCPRYMRGSRTTLSAHAWATAIDLNADDNGLGCTPAQSGQRGYLRDLVPIANQHRIYWGGHFRGRPDGMHFEHVGF
jgi:hypothetical protein